MMDESNGLPVRDSIRKLGHNSWIIGGRILLSRVDATPPGASFYATWSDGASAFFAISEYTAPPGEQISTEPLSPDCPIHKVYDAGDTNAAWCIGEAFCKVQALRHQERTREHVTLDYLHDPTKPISFPIPRPLYHAEFGGRYYLITSRLPGETLETAWPGMTEPVKQYCVDRLVEICKELALYGGRGNAICGIDGAHIGETWMAPPRQTVSDLSPQAQLAHCRGLRMDCSDLLFQHNDMGPQNIIVDLTQTDENMIGIIDWEMAGYVPRDWIRTKFRVCFAMDFEFTADDLTECREWRERVQLRLGKEGFHDVRDAYMTRWVASNSG